MQLLQRVSQPMPAWLPSAFSKRHCSPAERSVPQGPTSLALRLALSVCCQLSRPQASRSPASGGSLIAVRPGVLGFPLPSACKDLAMGTYCAWPSWHRVVLSAILGLIRHQGTETTSASPAHQTGAALGGQGHRCSSTTQRARLSQHGKGSALHLKVKGGGKAARAC